MSYNTTKILIIDKKLVSRCVNYSSIDLFPRIFPNEFTKYVSIILFFMGIFGNAYGYRLAKYRLFPASKQVQGRRSTSLNTSKLSINQYLLKWFYQINFINTFLMILSPILQIWGNADKNLIWARRDWNFYLAHIHYFLCKSLISFGFLIYILFFANELVAVFKPFQYRTMVTYKRINYLLLICFVACYVWHIPTIFWLKSYRVYICVNDTKRIPLMRGFRFFPAQYDNYGMFIWYHKANPISARSPTWDKLSKAYEISRDLCLRILPFLTVFIAKIYLIKRENKVAQIIRNYSSVAAESPSDFKSSFVAVDTVRSRSESRMSYIFTTPRKSSRIADEENKSKSSITGPSTSTWYTRKMEKNAENLKTLFVLTAEFIFFLLPISLIQMFWDFIAPRLSPHLISTWFEFFCLLEYVYVTCTFYFNFAFNKYYRKSAILSWKHDVNKV